MRGLSGKWLLPLVAAGMLVFAILHVVRAQQTPPNPPPPVEPARSPFGKTVAGAGIVEPSNEASTTSAIAVGSQLSGVIARINVHIGQTVKAGDVLITIDDRLYKAALARGEATVAMSKAQLAQSKATLAQSKANLVFQQADNRQKEAEWRRVQMLKPLAISDTDRDVARAAAETSAASVEQFKAAVAAAESAVNVAAKTVQQAEADRRTAEVNLDYCTIKAPVDGTVLQVNIRAGEYVTTFGAQSLVLMGNLDPLHIRVDIDEHDVPRAYKYFESGGTATASPRGDPSKKYALEFVRVEPYVIPKKSLTGDNTERVDTRVLEVIYRVKDKNPELYVGMQVDVFLDGDAPRGK
jgi:multidrug resistance efflux pump